MSSVDNILISLGFPSTNLSLDQGLQALNSLTSNGADVVDKNLLRDLVNRVSADALGSVTVLYSGEVNADVGLRPLSIINAMKNNGDDIRVIMDSPAAQFLGDSSFRQALADSLNVDIDDLSHKSTDANKFLESPDGLWGDVSANFIDATEGKVLTITGGAEDSRIFSQRELEKIQANEKIISVDGLDRTYLSNMSQEQAYKVIKVASDTSLANLHIVVDGNGNPALYGRQIMIDSRDFLASVNVDGHVSSNTAKYFAANTDAAMARVIEFVPAERWVEHTEGLNTLSSLELFGRFVGKLSVGISVLGLLVVSSQAQAAETPEQKQQIIDDWVGHTTAEWIAGSIGSALVVGGVAAFTAISAPVTLGLAIVGGIVGSIVGGDTVYELIKEGVNKVLSDIKSSLHSIVGEFLDQFDLNDVMGLYEQAEHVTSPLILDLNKDGVVGTRALSENIYFDHDGSGFKEKTGWVSSQDGLLVLDKNNNADIEIGNELFGNQTSLNNGQLAKNGFKALAEYDLNNDGVIDAKDEIYQQLQVWQDINQNAYVDQGELTGLQTIGIQQIDLAYTSAKQVDVNGNHHKQQGQFIWADGTVGKIDDVWFQVDTLHSQINQAQIVEIDPSIAVLPDIHQFGNVDSLHQAMAKDTNGILQQLVEQFVRTDSLLVRQQLVTDIIYQWTGVADLPSHERGMYWDDRHLLALEKIMGRQYHSFADPELTLSVGNNQAFALEQAWKLLRQKIYDQLYLQQKTPEIFEKIQITESNELDVTQLYSYIKQHSLVEVAELYDVLSRGPKLFKDVQNSLRELALYASTPDLIDQILSQTLQVHIPSVNSGFYTGTEGNDLLISNIETDIFIGGAGVNTYVFGPNSGKDTIQANHLYTNSSLTETHIILDALPQDIEIKLGSSDLILKMIGSNDQLTIENALLVSSTLKTITFKDNTVWTLANILPHLVGTENDDYLDTRAGSNDYLDGKEGINTYYFDRGYAHDTILAPRLTAKSALTETHIQLGVLPDDVSIELFDQSVRIKIKDSGDTLEVQDVFADHSVFKTITFVDQTIWTLTDILAQPLLGTNNNDDLKGIDTRDNKIYGFGGDDNLKGAIGNDYLDGGTGNDYLDGKEGINTYYFDRGYAHDTILAPRLTAKSALTETHIQLGVLPDDVSIELFDQSVRIKIKDSGDTLEVQDVFADHSVFKTITFVDQTIWTLTDILAQPLLGTNNNDDLKGIDTRDNKIYGFGGDDNLKGAIGNDYLDGGTGNDYLDGKEGINTYYFDRGYAHDTILAPQLTEKSVLTETHIQLGVLPEEVSIELFDKDIRIKIKGSEDTLEVRDVFADYSVFKTITFVDQTIWTLTDILPKLLLGTENDDDLKGIDTRDNKIYGFGGDDSISGGSGHDYLDGGDGDDRIVAGNGNDHLVGGSGDDYLEAGTGNDLLEGGEGDDYLLGLDGDDTLIGGQGNDELDGGSGINTYIFNKGDGVDVIKTMPIYEDNPHPIIETHIVFDVLPEDIRIDASADYIILKIKDTNDQLYIEDALSTNIGLQTITFADQTVWTVTDILARLILGTDGDDYLVATNAYDRKIYGFAGDDHLYGSIGNDYLDGGIGDDELNGGDGINTYVFNRGYGLDWINTPYLDEDSPQTETHILMDVLPSDISVEILDQDVFLTIKDTNDTLEIRGVFAEFSVFKTITFADQTVWTIQDLQDSALIDGNQDESLTDLLNGLADNSNYEEYGYLFDELPDNQSLVGQLEGNNTQVLTDSLVFEESSDVDYLFNLLTIEDMQKFNIDVDKLLRSANANSESEDTQNVKNSLTQKYQLDEVDDQIVFDNTSFSMPNNFGLWNSSFNQQFIA